MFLNLYQYFKLNDYIHDLVDLIVCLFFLHFVFHKKIEADSSQMGVFFFSAVQHKSSINMSLILWCFNRYQCFFRLKLEQLI